MHRHALVLDSAHVTAELVLPVRILDEFRLDGKSPHLVEGRALELHLVENLRANLDDLVGVQLMENHFYVTQRF